jgi:hypothetical protein
MRLNRTAIAALTGAVVAVVAGGNALAGQSGNDGQSVRCQDRLGRAAEKRGVSIAQLRAQIQARAFARIDAALAAGRISAEHAAKLKETFAAGRLCQRPRGTTNALGAKLGTRGLLRAAADYLDLTKAELRAELRGTSLGALALEQGKNVQGLEAAMLAPAEARLAKAVDAGRISQARADRRLDRLERRVDRLVARTFPAG